MQISARVSSIFGLVTNAASIRAANYREHAAELREIAAIGGDGGLDSKLLDLAKEYDALAEIADPA